MLDVPRTLSDMISFFCAMMHKILSVELTATSANIRAAILVEIAFEFLDSVIEWFFFELEGDNIFSVVMRLGISLMFVS